MTVLVVIAALVLEQLLLPYLYLRRTPWLDAWLTLHQSLPAPESLRTGPTGLLGLLLPPLLGVALVWMLLDRMLGPGSLVFSGLVLLYAFGPGELGLPVRSLRDPADAPAAAAAARDLLGRDPDATDPARDLALGVLAAGHRQTIAVILWFLLLGPVGALLYRLAQELRRLGAEQSRQGLAAASTSLVWLLDWLPARLMGGLLALAGCFEPALAAWRACDPARSRDPTIGVTLCVGAGALQLDTRPRPDAALDTALLDDALRLARRCLVVLLAVLVLAELSAWLL